MEQGRALQPHSPPPNSCLCPARLAGVATLPDGKIITVGGVLKSGVGGWGAVGKVRRCWGVVTAG